ncbi:MAG: zinc ribbon domain-containing protein [Clostridia bacterium]|nr:zinc ribbon domain-containing protein [Clostridia bacterium]
MFCPNCGNKVEDGKNFCPDCGTPLRAQTPSRQPRQDRQGSYERDYYFGDEQPRNTAPGGADQRLCGGRQNPANYAAQNAMPMKWHKFLVYFALWFSALVNLGAGLNALRGKNYGDQAARVYGTFKGMQAADVVYGAAVLGLAVLVALAAVNLLGFKRTGPKTLLWYFAASGAVSLIYAVAALIIIGDKSIMLNTISDGVNDYYFQYNSWSFVFSSVVSGAASAVMFLVHKAYYDKRAFMFVN